MCLNYSKQETLKLRNSGKKFITAYKAVAYSPFKNKLCSIYKSYDYEIGKNIAYGVKTKSGSGMIHVCLNRKSALEHTGTLELILKVRCFIDDLVSVSKIDDGYQDAGFTKIYISKKEYEKASKIAEDYYKNY